MKIILEYCTTAWNAKHHISWQDLVLLFQKLDDNDDGQITFEEFLNGLNQFKESAKEQSPDPGKHIPLYLNNYKLDIDKVTFSVFYG